MTHQELDDLFRANSERGEFAPEPGEWEEMTALLDEDERRERYARWISIGWMSLFILLISVGVIGLWNFQSENTRPVVSVKTKSTSPIQDLKHSNQNSSLNASEDQVALSNQTQVIEERAGLIFDENETDASGSASISFVEENYTAVSKDASTETLLGSEVLSSTLKQSKVDQQISDFPLADGQASSKASLIKTTIASPTVAAIFPDKTGDIGQLGSLPITTALTAEQELIEPNQAVTFTTIPVLSIGMLGLASNDVDDKQTFSSAPIVSAPKDSWSRFGVSLFVAEEATSVAMSSKVRFGTRAGALIHYKPFARWSIDVGVSYAHKSYMAPDGEMQNTLGLFIDDVLPFQTDGECDILEVPLTISYLPKGHGQAGPFISGGVLSYRIFREEMVFHYDEPTRQVDKASAPEVGSLFGTAHLQAGYRFVPKRGPVWRVGPYLQVPIAKVGSGKLPIYSGGLQVGIELF